MQREGRQGEKDRVSPRHCSNDTCVGHVEPTSGAGGTAVWAGLGCFSPHPLAGVCHKGKTEPCLSGDNEMLPEVRKALHESLGREVLRK